MAIGSVNPVTILANKLAPFWDVATARVSNIVDNPVGALIAMGPYLANAAIDAWNGIRDTYRETKMHMNFVTEIVSTECEDNWTVLVETALPAAGDAMLLFLVVSPKEVLEEYLQPKPLRSKRRGARNQKGVRRAASIAGRVRRKFPSFPDPDGFVASIIPGKEVMEGRNAFAGTRWLFTGIDLTDRVLWYWLLLDATNEFFYLWSSNLMEARFCSKPFGVLLAVERQIASHILTGFAWDDPDDLTINGKKNISLGNNGIIFLGVLPAKYTVVYTCSFHYPIDQPDGVIVRIRIFDEDFTLLGNNARIMQKGNNYNLSLTISQENPTFDQKRFNFEANASPIRVEAVDLSIMLFGN